jgi:hypothetical protein
VRLLRASITGEASARGERARELGKQARDRINTDFDIDNPSTPPRASQKLIAATTLLRVMPAPSTPEARNLHREAQALVEKAAVQQAESSASRIRHQGSAWDDGGAQGPEASVHADGATERPANQGRTPVKERILDTRGQAKDGDARNVINARRTGNAEARAAAGYHPCRGGRYDSREVRSPTPEPPGTRVFSGRSARRAYRSAFASPRPSTSTRGRQIPVYGSTTIAWRASWAEPPPTRSSSATYRYTSPTRRGRGSSTCRPVRFTTGTTWSAPSWGTSRARTYALETPGICARAPRSPASRSGLHTALLQALHGAPERGPVRDRARLPRGHDLPRPRARARAQSTH